MARIIIEFDIDGAAFEDDFEGEIEHILEDAKEFILTDGVGSLMDSNGNHIGTVETENEDDDDEETVDDHQRSYGPRR
jgi:hypothetical protein